MTPHLLTGYAASDDSAAVLALHLTHVIRAAGYRVDMLPVDALPAGLDPSAYAGLVLTGTAAGEGFPQAIRHFLRAWPHLRRVPGALFVLGHGPNPSSACRVARAHAAHLAACAGWEPGAVICATRAGGEGLTLAWSGPAPDAAARLPVVRDWAALKVVVAGLAGVLPPPGRPAVRPAWTDRRAA